MIKTSSVAFKFLWRRKIRSGLILIGIILSVTFTVSIATVLDSIYLDFSSQARNDSFADIVVTSTNYEYFSSSVLEKLASLRNAEVSPTIFLSYDISTSDLQASFIVIGLDPRTNRDFKSIKMLAGKHSLSGNEILVNEDLANGLNLRVGQVIPITLNESSSTNDLFPKTYVKVSGIFRHPNFNNIGKAPLILINLNTLQAYLKKKSQINRLIITVTDILKVFDVARKVQALIGSEYNVITYTQFNRGDALIVVAYRAALNIVIILTILIEFVFLLGMLIINVSDQMREFGILKTLGTSNKEILTFLLLQMLILGGIGTLVGLVLGRLLALTLVSYFGQLVDSWRAPPLAPLTLNYILLAFLIGIVVTILSSLYPISLALRLPNRVMIYERSFLTLVNFTKMTRIRTWTTPTLLLAFSLGIIGILLSYQVKASQLLEVRIFSVHYIAIFSLLFAIMLLQIVIVIRVLPVLTKKTINKFLSFALATRDLSRNMGRTTLTLMAITLSLTFLLLISILINSLAIGVPQWYSDSFGIDIVADTGENHQAPLSIYNQIKNLYFVDTAFYIQEQKIPIESVDALYLYGIESTRLSQYYSTFLEQGQSDALQQLSTLYIVPNSDFIIRQNHTVTIFSLPKSLYTYKSIDISTANITHETISTNNSVVIPTVLSSFYAQDKQIPLYSLIKAEINRTFSFYLYITAIIRSNFFLQTFSYTYIESTIMQRLLNHTTFRYLYLTLKQTHNISNEDIQNTLNKIYPFSYINTIHLLSEQIRKGIQRQQIFLQTLLSEALLLATLSQFFMLLVASLHMSYDIALLRTMGVSKRGVFRIFFFQSLLLMGISVVFSIFNAILGSSIFLFYFNTLGAHIPLIMPFDQLLFWLTVYLTVLILTAKIPATGAAEREITEILTGRNINIKNIIMSHPLVKALPQWRAKAYHTIKKSKRKTFISVITITSILILPFSLLLVFIWKTRHAIIKNFSKYQKPLLIIMLTSFLITLPRLIVLNSPQFKPILSIFIIPVPLSSILVSIFATLFSLQAYFKESKTLSSDKTLFHILKEKPLNTILGSVMLFIGISVTILLWYILFFLTIFYPTTVNYFYSPSEENIRVVNTAIITGTNSRIENDLIFTPLLQFLILIVRMLIEVFFFPLIVLGLIFYFLFVPALRLLKPHHQIFAQSSTHTIKKQQSTFKIILSNVILPFLTLLSAQIIIISFIVAVNYGIFILEEPDIYYSIFITINAINDVLIYPIFFSVVTLNLLNSNINVFYHNLNRLFKRNIEKKVHKSREKALKSHLGFIDRFV